MTGSHHLLHPFYGMIQGEVKGQAGTLLADYIREAGWISPPSTPPGHQLPSNPSFASAGQGNRQLPVSWPGVLILDTTPGWYGRSLAFHLK